MYFGVLGRWFMASEESWMKFETITRCKCKLVVTVKYFRIKIYDEREIVNAIRFDSTRLDSSIYLIEQTREIGCNILL